MRFKMTIKEVAKLAGVSSAAVSRYLNGGPLSQKKKEQIAKAIEETGYRPNLMAKTMRTGKVRQIGIIVPRIFSESVNQVMDGLAEEFLEKDYLTLLGYSDKRKDRELQYLEMMQSNRVAGIILMATTLSDIKRLSLEKCSVPLVITGQNFDGFPCVYHDDKGAVKELTSLMIAKGRKKIVYIGVFEDDKAAGLARSEGVQEALREAGFDADQLPIVIADFDTRSGYTCMIGLLEKYPDLDGVICATDIIAHGAMYALKERGKRIPEDVSIAGVGDNWADLVSMPKLTTAHLYHKRCGSEAARMLLKMIGEAGQESGEEGKPAGAGEPGSVRKSSAGAEEPAAAETSGTAGSAGATGEQPFEAGNPVTAGEPAAWGKSVDKTAAENSGAASSGKDRKNTDHIKLGYRIIERESL